MAPVPRDAVTPVPAAGAVAPAPGDGPAPVLAPLGDVRVLVDLHRTYFPGNVIGRLGRPLLRVYYRGLVDSPYALVLGVGGPGAVVAGTGDRPLAYVAGVLDTAQHRRWVRRHQAPALLGAVLLAVVLHPVLAAGLVRRRVGLLGARVPVRLRRRPSAGPAVPRPRTPEESAGPASAPLLPVGVVSHLAVVTSARGRGHAARLLDAFDDAARRAGTRRLAVATLATGGAAGLYEARGWQRVAERRTFDGRDLLLYERTLTDRGPTRSEED